MGTFGKEELYNFLHSIKCSILKPYTQIILVNSPINPWNNQGFWKPGSVWHWAQVLKLLLNTAFPCAVNNRDRYQRTGNRLDIEGWKVETISLQTVESWRHAWSKVLCFRTDKLFLNSKLLVTTDTAQGSSLPHILHCHPSSFRIEKIKVSARHFCLIGLIVLVTWWELKQYTSLSKDSLSTRGVWHPSR